MLALITTAAFVLGVCARPMLARAFYRLRGLYRFGFRKSGPAKPATTTATLSQLIESEVVCGIVEQASQPAPLYVITGGNWSKDAPKAQQERAKALVDSLDKEPA